MKLLFDQNISHRIVLKLNELLPFSSQVRLLGLENAKDVEIWQFSKENDYTIVTFDTDFFDLSLIRGIPPKIIWLRIGNTATEKLVECLKENIELIKDFINNPENKELACLEIYH
jgi:predicted nuclease of predicted toxin-antitoxin system